MSRVIKVSLDGDLRRIAVPAANLSSAELNRLVCERFGAGTLRLAYVDEDGDRITLSRDEDVEEALRVTAPPAPLRLFAVLADEQAGYVSSASSARSLSSVSASSAEGYVVMEEQRNETTGGAAGGAAGGVESEANETSAAETPVVAADAAAAEEESPAAQAPQPHDVLGALFAAFVPILAARNNPEVAAALHQSAQHVVDAISVAGIELRHAAIPAASAVSAAAPTGVVHSGVTCDGCGMSPIREARFKCSICGDYDLCSACEAKGVHPADHPMIKLRVPFTEVTCRIERAEDEDRHRRKEEKTAEVKREKADARRAAMEEKQAALAAKKQEKQAERAAAQAQREAEAAQRVAEKMAKKAAKMAKIAEAEAATATAAAAAAVEAEVAAPVEEEAAVVVEAEIVKRLSVEEMELFAMGFDPDAAREALRHANGDVIRAANMLLG